jgi:hypothetical protein
LPPVSEQKPIIVTRNISYQINPEGNYQLCFVFIILYINFSDLIKKEDEDDDEIEDYDDYEKPKGMI